MSFTLKIPKVDGTPLEIVLNIGESIFLLGANGSGKSALMHRLYVNHSKNARRISAHRQAWFSSNIVSLTPQQKKKYEDSIKGYDIQAPSRWKEDYPEQRASMAIFDLIESENLRAREITSAVDQDNIQLAQTLSKKDSPIKVINELLRLSNIPIEISVRKNEEVMARKFGSKEYSIAELSDGERNVILIATSVLTAEEKTLILIDEPERHLHRSIISPLLTQLFIRRSDCSFIISTHDVLLPMDNPEAQVMLVRDCNYSNSVVTSWDIDVVRELDESIKVDILGARRKILFVEGKNTSLDKALYRLIFPNVSVIAKSSCRDVEHAVSGIREGADLHWLNPFGIVDNDRRTQAEKSKLKEKGIYALPFYSVESIYYHPKVQRYVAENHAVITGEDPNNMLEKAKIATIKAIEPHVKRLCIRSIEKKIREEFFDNMPNKDEIEEKNTVRIDIDIQTKLSEEIKLFEDAIENENISNIIERYPVRETPALTEIARKLGFQSNKQYEGTVRTLILEEKEMLKLVKSFFGTLPTDTESSLFSH